MNRYILPVVMIFILLFSSCKMKEPVYDNFSGFIQGTTYSMVFENPGKIVPLELKSDVEKILHDFDMSLSMYVDSSILSGVNRNEDVDVDDYFAESFKKSAEISAMTDGAFDITVAPFVKAWGFGPDSHKNFSEAKRDSLLKFVGMDKVKLADRKIVKTDPGVTLDFNAIAQGYSVDVIYNYFKSLGIKSFLIEIGGEVRVKGDKNGAMWKIGIDKPEENNMVPGNNLEAIIQLKDRSLATSGNYRKFYVENGIKYSHTIDPRTGYPAKNQLLSATIVADECAVADGIATACMVMGKDKAIEFLGSHSQFDGFLIYSDDTGSFRTWISKKLQSSVSETE